MLIQQFFGTSLLTPGDFTQVPVLFSFFIVILALKLMLFYLLRDWYFARRRVIKHSISAEFRPPLDLNPAEVSYMFSRTIGDQAFAGLVVHMAQRGIIHFRKHKGTKIVLPGPRHVDNLTYYERMILKAVVEHRNVTARDLVEYNHTIFKGAQKYTTFTAQVRHTLERRGFLKTSQTQMYIWCIARTTFVLLAIGVWFVLGAHWLYDTLALGSSDVDSFMSLLYSCAVYTLYFAIPAALASTAFKILTSRYAGRKGVAQRKLKKFWPHVIGFRQYVVLSETGKLHFDEEVLKRKASINTLPYAIALGLVDNWRDIVY